MSINAKTIREFILRWNNQHPLDYRFRQKYNIPFGSKEHRECSFLSQRLDYEEERLVEEQSNKKSNLDENEIYETGDEKQDKMINSLGKTKAVKMSQKEIDHTFNKLDKEAIEQLYKDVDINKVKGNEKDKDVFIE